MSQHTPGPWTCRPAVYADHSEWSVDTPLRRVALVNNGSDNAQANARLIAKAPEMYAILEQLVSCIGREHGDRATYQHALDACALLREIEEER